MSWWIWLLIILVLVPGIRWILKRNKDKFGSLLHELKEKKFLIIIILLVVSFIGVSSWLVYSLQQADSPEKRYEKAFVEEVLPNINQEVLSLDVLVKKIENHEVEKAYRQFRSKESTTIVKYYMKFKGEEGYHLFYVPWNFNLVVASGFSSTQMSLDTFLTQFQEDIPVYVMPANPSAPLSPIFFAFPVVFLVFILFMIFWFRRMGGGKFLKSGARGIKSQVTFADVGGIDEAKEETEEIVKVLKNPAPYLELSAKVPKGILLHGPPGTGKTLLARAIAGEAGVPNFSISGSEFHEMFVGVGASRARNLFKDAEKHAPSILIIDELDSAAPKRSAGLELHPEAVGLVNQLLSLLDRLEKENIPVFVMGITNRPDMLDSALLRPGRFDRHIEVPLPTAEGRKMILKIHITRPKLRPVDFDLESDLDVLVRETEGFSGAHLAMLVNEAAIRAVRENRKVITLEDFRSSIERVLMGPERKFKLSKEETKLVAYHESGHALIATLLPQTDPVHFISILPHGRSLGYTRLLPETEYHVIGETRIFNQIKVFMGGRAAEEICFKERSTGAAQDLNLATSIARTAVCIYGMSSLGPIRIADPANESYSLQLWSEEMRREVDKEVRNLLNECYEDSLAKLKENKDKLDMLVRGLLEKKRLVRSEINEILGVSSD